MCPIIALELYRRDYIIIKRAHFDGGPFFLFSNKTKWKMRKIFETICYFSKLMPKTTLLIYRKKLPYLVITGIAESMIEIAGRMTKKSIYNLVTACYSFVNVNIDERLMKNATFIYGANEPAIKCMAKLQRLYPESRYIVKKDLNHLQFQAQYKKDYVEVLLGSL